MQGEYLGVAAMSLEFRRGGRKVSLDQFMKGIKKDAIDLGSKAVEDRLRRTRCPVHGTAPTNIRRENAGGDGRVVFSVCCDALKASASKAFR